MSSPAPAPSSERKHAFLAPESLAFAIATVGMLILTAMVGREGVVAGQLDSDTYQLAPNDAAIDPDGHAFDLGMATCGVLVLALIAMATGIVALRQRQGRRTLAVLGIAITIASLLGLFFTLGISANTS